MPKTYSEWLPTFDYEVINAPTFSFTKMDENKKFMLTVKSGFLLERSKESKNKKHSLDFSKEYFNI